MLQFALLAMTSMLFIVNPISVIPTYLVITEGQSTRARAATARRACIVAACILAAFALAGQQVFRLFGITIDAFRVAGGFILWVVAMDMLHGVRKTQESDTEISESSAKTDVSVTPLAMPMLAGPGAISTIMVLAAQASSAWEKLAVYAAVLVTMGVAWAALRIGERLLLRLGETGIRVLTRLMGLLLAAIAVQFVMTGLLNAWKAHQS